MKDHLFPLKMQCEVYALVTKWLSDHALASPQKGRYALLTTYGVLYCEPSVPIRVRGPRGRLRTLREHCILLTTRFVDPALARDAGIPLHNEAGGWYHRISYSREDSARVHAAHLLRSVARILCKPTLWYPHLTSSPESVLFVEERSCHGRTRSTHGSGPVTSRPHRRSDQKPKPRRDNR